MSLILSGTDGLSDVDGTAATPAIRGTDANTGIFFPAADTIGFSEGGVEAARINSSGQFDLVNNPVLTGGTANGVAYLNGSKVLTTGSALVFDGTNLSTTGYITATNTSNTTVAAGGFDASTSWSLKVANASTTAGTGAGIFFLGGTNSESWIGNLYDSSGVGALSFQTRVSGTRAERMRIDSSGNLLVGTTSAPSYSSKLRVQGGIETQGTNQYNIVATSSGSDFEWVLRSGSRQLYYVANATVVANLSAAGVWTNASDARYKENIVDSQYGLSTVMALKPRLYNLIDQADKPQVGFIAQEVIDVVPEVVESIHNSVTGEDRYTLSYGNLVAVLTKAIQEQNQLITQLTARITALEGA